MACPRAIGRSPSPRARRIAPGRSDLRTDAAAWRACLASTAFFAADDIGLLPFAAPGAGAADFGKAPRFAAGARFVPPRGAAVAFRLDLGPADGPALPRGAPFEDFGPAALAPFGALPPLRPPRAGLIAPPPQLRNRRCLRRDQLLRDPRRDCLSP